MARGLLNRISAFSYLVLFYCLAAEATNYKKKIGKPSDFHQFRTVYMEQHNGINIG